MIGIAIAAGIFFSCVLGIAIYLSTFKDVKYYDDPYDEGFQNEEDDNRKV